jgi:hypothetical protein
VEGDRRRLIRGSDRYVGGSGGMAWKLLGLVPVVRAEGPDASRSAAERAAGESIWVPTALAAGDAATWSATGDDELNVTLAMDGHRVTLHHELDRTAGCAARASRAGAILMARVLGPSTRSASR